MKKGFDRYCSRRSSGYDYRRDSGGKRGYKERQKESKRYNGLKSN